MNTFTDSAILALRLLAGFDPVLLSIVGRSLAVRAAACVLACGVGLLAGAWLGVARFTGRPFLLATTPTANPAAVRAQSL